MNSVQKKAIREKQNQLKLFRAKVEELRREVYGDRPLVDLSDFNSLKEGHYYLVVSNSGTKHITQYMGAMEVWSYDAGEWCVADRDSMELYPGFKTNRSKGLVNFVCKGVEITEDEYVSMLKNN